MIVSFMLQYFQLVVLTSPSQFRVPVFSRLLVNSSRTRSINCLFETIYVACASLCVCERERYWRDNLLQIFNLSLQNHTFILLSHIGHYWNLFFFWILPLPFPESHLHPQHQLFQQQKQRKNMKARTFKQTKKS